MKNVIKSLLVVVAVAAFSTSSFAQQTATDQASATADIITPISIHKTQDMSFGNIAVSSTTSGTVILAPAGTRTTGGAGGVSLPANTGTVTNAEFTVTGVAGYTYSITLPAGPVSLSDGVSGTMNVTAFTSTPTVLAGGTLTGGTQTLKVGATLAVTNGQAVGHYAAVAPFDVTVNYN